MKERKYLVIVLSILVVGVSVLSCDIDHDPLGVLIGKSNVEDRFEDYMKFNSTADNRDICIDTNSYEIFLGSDLHLEDDTKYLSSFLDKAKDKVFSVVLGDLANSKSNYYDSLNDSLKSYQNMLFYPIIGNHDLYSKGYNSYKEHFGSSIYSFVVKAGGAKDLYIALDSACGGLGKKQISWLKNILSSRNNYRHCFIMTHVNMLIPDKTLDLVDTFDRDELYMLTSLFDKHDVTAVITGHLHVEGKKVYRGVDYIMLPPMCGDDGYTHATAAAKFMTISDSGYKLENVYL